MGTFNFNTLVTSIAAIPPTIMDKMNPIKGPIQTMLPKNTEPERPPKTPIIAMASAMYPIEGGMVATLQVPSTVNNRFMTLSGIETIQEALSNLEVKNSNRGLFIELLACENGCIKGPGTTVTTPIGSRMAVLDYVESEDCSDKPIVADCISCNYSRKDISSSHPTQEQLQLALEKIGKFSQEEELNCDSCGYGTCRGLAAALVENKAEPCMCSSYMRQLAQNKANALIKTLPYGVVIVDSNLRIIDSNERFAHLFGDEIEEISRVIPGLKNADLSRILPFHDLFLRVLSTGEDITQQFVKHKNQVFALTIFTVERASIAGAILRDATLRESKREQIVEKAQEVIRNTSVTAQQIAFLMGKNAAQSEKILNSLVECFSNSENIPGVQEH